MPESRTFNGDCLEAMRVMPDKAFDLAIVDPEYGINLKGPCGHFQQYGGLQSVNGRPPSELYFSELFRVSTSQVIWGGNYFNLPPARCFLVWDKGESMYGRSFAECELAWTSFDEVARMFKLIPNTKNRFHPTQKPVALYKWILTNYAKPGDTILDTHLGSGSSRIAAHDLGFGFTGYELDADYFAAQEQRFAEHIAQPTLFAPASAPVLAQPLFFTHSSLQE